MVFNVIFNKISVLRGSQFYWWRKAEYMDKTTDLPQVTDKLYHLLLYQVQFTTGGCQSNYNKIMTTMAHPAQHPLFQNTNVLVYCNKIYVYALILLFGKTGILFFILTSPIIG